MENNLITTENTVLDTVGKRNGFAEGFISFRAYYGEIIKGTEDKQCNEYIDEGIYFLAAKKLDIIIKGNMSREPGQKTSEFVEDGTSDKKNKKDWFPQNKYITEALHELGKTNEYAIKSVYMIKRKSFGFYVGDSETINLIVKEPLLKLLCDFNNAMKEEMNKMEKARILLESQGLPLSLLNSRDLKQRIIKKFFK